MKECRKTWIYYDFESLTYIISVALCFETIICTNASNRLCYLRNMISKRVGIHCGKQLSIHGKRPLTISSFVLRIFVSAHMFPSPVPDDYRILETCHWICRNWSAERHVKEVLLRTGSPSKCTNVVSERTSW